MPPSLVFPISQLYRMLCYPPGDADKRRFTPSSFEARLDILIGAPHHPEFYWLVSAAAVAPLPSSSLTLDICGI